MQEYTQIRRVTESDLDGMGHVNNVRYVAWIQEISEQHWEERVPEKLRDTVAWVVYNHNITYYAPALPDDRIRISTHIEKTEKMFSYRVVKMFRESDDTLLVEATTTWCMVDVQTHKPKRISQEIIDLFL